MAPKARVTHPCEVSSRKVGVLTLIFAGQNRPPVRRQSLRTVVPAYPCCYRLPRITSRGAQTALICLKQSRDYERRKAEGFAGLIRERPQGVRKTKALTPFRMNTCKSVSKQKTLSTCTINTYAKTGGRGVLRFAVSAARIVRLVRRAENECSRPAWPSRLF